MRRAACIVLSSVAGTRLQWVYRNAAMGTPYQFGIEEELFLADAETRGTPRDVQAFHSAVRKRIPEVERELLESQVEIMTAPCTDFATAQASLSGLRSGLAEIGREHGVLVFAGGSHPIARWRRQRRTAKARYDEIADDLQLLARRDVVCGMHVHVETPCPETRVGLMRRMLPYTPIFLALSASSPFWEGRETGLSAYRMSVWGEMPRTGLPELFVDQTDYDRYVAAMVRSGAIKDATFLWWTLRPSTRFPTLELRVADSCTRLEDTLAIAALYRCLVRRLDRNPDINAGLTAGSRAIVSENMWRAQRSGVSAEFIDESGSLTPFRELLDQLLGDVAKDADELGCSAQVAKARQIVTGGASADCQRAIFAQTRAGGLLRPRRCKPSSTGWRQRQSRPRLPDAGKLQRHRAATSKPRWRSVKRSPISRNVDVGRRQHLIACTRKAFVLLPRPRALDGDCCVASQREAVTSDATTMSP